MVKIATWNLGYGFGGSFNKVDQALGYMEKAKVDILLAQEIYLPAGSADGEVIGSEGFYKHRLFTNIPRLNPENSIWESEAGNDSKNENDTTKWGTAVLSTEKYKLQPVKTSVTSAYPGTFTAARIEPLNLTVISMYGKNIPPEYYVTNLERCLDDLDSTMKSAGKIVIGGDLNIGLLASRKELTGRDAKFFNRLEEVYGLENCVEPEYQITCHRNRDSEAGTSQVDWLFASEGLLKTPAKIDHDARKYSDHYPIIAEFK